MDSDSLPDVTYVTRADEETKLSRHQAFYSRYAVRCVYLICDGRLNFSIERNSKRLKQEACQRRNRWVYLLYYLWLAHSGWINWLLNTLLERHKCSQIYLRLHSRRSKKDVKFLRLPTESVTEKCCIWSRKFIGKVPSWPPRAIPELAGLIFVCSQQQSPGLRKNVDAWTQ